MPLIFVSPIHSTTQLPHHRTIPKQPLKAMIVPTCFQDRQLSEEYTSPFDRAIVGGYYDGATGGVLYNSQTFEGCLFEMVAWDSLQDWRLFATQKLAVNAIVPLVSALNDVSTSAKWPYWVLSTQEAEQLNGPHFFRDSVECWQTVDSMLLATDVISSAIMIVPTVKERELVLQLIREATILDLDEWCRAV